MAVKKTYQPCCSPDIAGAGRGRRERQRKQGAGRRGKNGLELPAGQERGAGAARLHAARVTFGCRAARPVPQPCGDPWSLFLRHSGAQLIPASGAPGKIPVPVPGDSWILNLRYGLITGYTPSSLASDFCILRGVHLFRGMGLISGYCPLSLVSDFMHTTGAAPDSGAGMKFPVIVPHPCIALNPQVLRQVLSAAAQVLNRNSIRSPSCTI